MIITALVRLPRRRISVVVDGEPALTVGVDVIAERRLREGATVTQAELSALADEDARRRGLEAAYRLLAARPRSERELRDRLARRGFRRGQIDFVTGRLRELGYLDDAGFARYWTEQRAERSPRARRLIRAELVSKGVSGDIATSAVEDVSDEEAAYRAAGRRLRALRGLEYREFRERLGAFLTRRGFGYEVARRTIQRCWEEVSGEKSDAGEATDE